LTGRGPKPSEVSCDPLDLGRPPLRVGRVAAGGDLLRAAPGGAAAESADARPRRAGGVVRVDGLARHLPDDERLPLLDEVRSLLTAVEYRRVWETHVHWTRVAAHLQRALS
jgi:hypothetical protein